MTNKKIVSTLKMVQNMMHESAKVNRSVGVIKEFRTVLEFVLNSKWYQDDDTGSMISR